MKPALVLLAGLGALAAALPGPGAAEDWVVLVGGDTDGYLSPCGCTKPMTGGIRRRASAVAALRQPDRTLILENGGLVKGQSRQDELKAEAMAQFLKEINVDAIHLTPSETKLGPGILLSLSGLSEERLVTSSLQPSEDVPFRPNVAKGPFLVGGASVAGESLASPVGLTSVPLARAVERLVSDAKATGKAPVLMLAGGAEDARKLAKEHPELALVIYRSGGSPSAEPAKEGKTWLVSPGERGMHLLNLRFRDSEFRSYQAVALDPRYEDEKATQRIYSTYLKRVDEEDLLEAQPRSDGPAFAGTQKCGSCHQAAMKVWKGSEHAHALASLEKEGHDRDPECVSCHVVGVRSLKGFRDRKATPQLADVGCESCHGPSAAHASSPTKILTSARKPAQCVSCHDTENSPRFDFSTYWKKIKH